MARQARVDWYGDQKNIKVPKGVNVSWHNRSDPKEATITADTDILLDEFKVNAHSTTEIVAKHDFTPPVDTTPKPTQAQIDESEKRRQAKVNYDAVLKQQRVDGEQTEYDKL